MRCALNCSRKAPVAAEATTIIVGGIEARSTWVEREVGCAGGDCERRTVADIRYEGEKTWLPAATFRSFWGGLGARVVDFGSPSHLSGACKLARKGLQVTCLPQGSARPPKPRNTTSSLLPPLN